MKLAPIIAALVLLFGSTRGSVAHNLGFTALAVPVDSLVIDGAAGDWPASAPRYPLESVLKGYPTYDSQDPTAEDLTAWFRAAWSPRRHRLFVLLEVVDDQRALGSGAASTDAMELYVDGSHGEHDPQQYLMFPGSASFSPFDSSDNPTLNRGDIDTAGGVGAWTESGDTIRYEWSVQSFENLPGKPSELTAGRRIGFDLVAVDKDQSGRGATWLSWSPTGGKVANASRLGDVTLIGADVTVEQMARVQGRVVMPGVETGWRGMTVRLFDADDKNWASATSGIDGRFELLGTGGAAYLVVPDAEPEARIDLVLQAGETTQALIPVLQRRGNRLPAWPFVVTLGLFTLVSFGSMWPLRRQLSLLGGVVRAPDATMAHLAAHPEWVGGSALALLSAALASVALLNILPGQLWGALLGLPGVLSTILLMTVPTLMFLALVVLQFASWMAWSVLLWFAGRLAGGKGRLFHVVSATGYAGVPVLLGLVIGTVAAAFGIGIGHESVTMSPFTGFSLLGLADGALNDALWRVELFQLWTWALGALVLRHVMGLPAMRAVVVTAACWVTTFLLIFSFELGLRSISASLAGLS